MSDRRLLTVEAAAEYLSYSSRTLYNRIGPKSKSPFPVKPIRSGKSVRFDLKDLDAYIEGLKKDDQR